MIDAESAAVGAGRLVLVLLVADLGLGLALERTGAYPGAMATATSLAAALFVCTAVCGLALLAMDVLGHPGGAAPGEGDR